MSAIQESETEKFRVFPCPNCKEYINNQMTECSFCHFKIDLVEARKAIASQDRENKIFRRQHYKRHMLKHRLIQLHGIVVINHFPVYHRQQRLDVFDLIYRAGEKILRDNNQVGELAWFNRTFTFFFK